MVKNSPSLLMLNTSVCVHTDPLTSIKCEYIARKNNVLFWLATGMIAHYKNGSPLKQVFYPLRMSLINICDQN